MGGRRLLAWQMEAIRRLESVIVLLGGYGSGKTTGAAVLIALHALSTPWTSDYEGAHPETLVIGKTDKVLKDSSLKTLKQVIPSQLIRKEWSSPGERSILLSNGHLIKMRTWSGSIEGLTVTALWLDEAHLLDDSQAFANYVARVRDPFARKRKIVVSGIPEFGWLQDLFGPQASYPDSWVKHISTYDNTSLREQDIARIAASCSARDAAVYLRGQWTAPDGAVFHAFDASVNVTSETIDRQQPVDLAMDVGEQGAVVFMQRKPDIIIGSAREPGLRLHVVDELLPDAQSAGQTAQQAKARGWRVVPGQSMIFVDPTTDRDERQAIEAAFPGVQIVRKIGADESKNREYGVRCVNAAFRDSEGRTRLTIARQIGHHRRGLLASIPAMKRSDKSGKIVKDNRTDHVCDALRYAVAHHLPLKGIRKGGGDD